ncbi:MAG: hypothetical protein Q4P24_15900, partial [Rhodobacterales bacterium]|nr:hypothetical protein [Rhodobacterales bacterium]
FFTGPLAAPKKMIRNNDDEWTGRVFAGTGRFGRGALCFISGYLQADLKLSLLQRLASYSAADTCYAKGS